ncbi:hypothetical protein GZ064_07080 [Wolbachia endosymbiont of Diaphorina citri]|uniref:hypothetical protein n=1 Tax=Wolbachia endosymbiont of Diaphorina citri TaxID=116598 RepID=UPI00220AA104|nr:hypothetical protein [Wolbachia endosymbiont of Diaphorina citri]QXY87559.1 hypothetical protein GZ064_07080 [Wolbachia endosymbiont of Diaphorina citri]
MLKDSYGDQMSNGDSYTNKLYYSEESVGEMIENRIIREEKSSLVECEKEVLQSKAEVEQLKKLKKI